MKYTLKRCPFCGDRPVLSKVADIYFIECENPNCLVWPMTLEYPNEAGAVMAWNTRARRVQPQATDERLVSNETNDNINSNK